MKNLIYLLTLMLCFSSCSSDISTKADLDNLTGKWKLTEAYISSGESQYWVDIENGEELIFYEDKTFVSNKYSECTNGIFSIEMDELSLKYLCDEFESEQENQNGLITFTIEFKADYFIVTPTSGPMCIEGCSYKYRKQ